MPRPATPSSHPHALDSQPSPARRRLVRAAILAGFGSVLPVCQGAAAAQAVQRWTPGGTVRLVVPFAAGGTADLVARLLAEGLARRLGHPVIVENRAGAGGNIGIASVARAAPDGRTLLLASTAFLTNPALHPDQPPYDPVRQFAAISELVSAPDVILVRSDSPFSTLGDLLAKAKASAGAASYATPGNGNSVHLGAELLWQKVGVTLLHVPYNGAAPAIQAVLGGQVDCALSALPPALPLLAGGKLRALALGGTSRWHALPGVPTIAESGFAGYRSETMQALYAPAGTPPAAIDRLHREVASMLAEAPVRRRLAEMGFAVVAGSPEALSKRVAEEVPRWARVAATARIRAD
ncbi:tripartite tricarboxylate transporter substrate-binding protein [Cupriavidus sp. MP-37]|uniref:tripartite tricarboxylate transporter substrate-binding protein n=1 Tax=Cupriavidus sp. MP-37 TaxID=2884455 RepID=UPI001D0B87C1|nr:tripartite tricarboxylate transporter substrate-binding protein [Cupriavidus sp. MP-37]UDM52378.1 tripartite tricarboxylate transporter substrate binding protein [Cupriavidus sp. MP-37]